MTLQALHNRIGATAFRAVLRGWVADHRYQSVTTAEFERYAQQVSGVDLTAFFRVWLHEPGKPAPTVENGFPPGAG
jgi:aminopeptidase N